jgi:hypothetical protein
LLWLLFWPVHDFVSTVIRHLGYIQCKLSCHNLAKKLRISHRDFFYKISNIGCYGNKKRLLRAQILTFCYKYEPSVYKWTHTRYHVIQQNICNVRPYKYLKINMKKYIYWLPWQRKTGCYGLKFWSFATILRMLYTHENI